MGSHPTGRGLLPGTEFIGIRSFRLIEFLFLERQRIGFVVRLSFVRIIQRFLFFIWLIVLRIFRFFIGFFREFGIFWFVRTIVELSAELRDRV